MLWKKKQEGKNHDCIVELYHCNYESRVESFFKHKELRISHHKDDSEWGGTGMYFWDNEGNAEYWKNKKMVRQIFFVVMLSLMLEMIYSI